MKICARHAIPRRNAAEGFTLVEMLIGVGLGSLMFAVIATLTVFGTRSFISMANYVVLDNQSRNAADVIGREIRDASAVVTFQTNRSLTLTNATQGKTITLTYDPNARTLVLQKTGQPAQTALTQCDQWSFSLYDRAPLVSSTNISFHSATNGSGQLDPTFCKLVNMSWKCSRTLMQVKMTTENVQTAEIVLRNKVQ